MMRDKIISNVTDKFQELLLREDELDFQKCIKNVCRAFEHVQEIRDTHENTVHKINRKDEHSNERNKERQQILGTRPRADNEGRRFPLKTKMKNCTICGFKHNFKKRTVLPGGNMSHLQWKKPFQIKM